MKCTIMQYIEQIVNKKSDNDASECESLKRKYLLWLYSFPLHVGVGFSESSFSFGYTISRKSMNYLNYFYFNDINILLWYLSIFCSTSSLSRLTTPTSIYDNLVDFSR